MKYICVRQHEMTDCGAACIATIAACYGYQTTVTKMRELSGTDRQGTSAYGLVLAAQKIGLKANPAKGNQEAFFSDIPLPCIAHVNMKNGLQHYVVIHKISKEQIILADPAEGIVRISPKEFFDGKYQWTGVLIFFTPSEDFQKKNEKENVLHKFFQLIFPQKKFMLLIFIFSLLYTGIGIFTAFYFKYLVDNIIPGNKVQLLTTISCAIIGICILRTILDYARSHLLLILSQKLDSELLMGYYQHILKLPMNFFGSRKTGDIIARFNDASHVRDAISSAALSVVLDTLMAVVGGIILYLQNIRMFLITVCMIILYGIIVAAFRKKYRIWNRKQMDENAELTSYLVESINGMQTIKAFRAEAWSEKISGQKFQKLLKSLYHLNVQQNVQAALKLTVELIGGIIILWVGALSVIQGEITIGTLVVFQSLLAYFLTPIKDMINLQPQIQTAVAAADRLSEILDLSPEIKEEEQEKKERKTLGKSIEFSNINFRYGTRELVLKELSFRIEAGQKIAFVGESGSGKTTLSKLLLHFYQAESGQILLDEASIEDIKIDTIRDRIAYISQETFLFSGTIRENLLLGNPEATKEEIIIAAKIAQAHTFIEEFPSGYETQLIENGQNLSGGQRQRLSIARALLKDPDILILDEATSNLDTLTENLLSENLEKYGKEKIYIYIAHRLSSIKHCDRIFVMDEGKIVEQGTHEELYVKNGYYTKLVQAAE